jgi:hypothetical protein
MGHVTKMTIARVIRRSLFYVGLALAGLAIFTLIFALSVRTHTSIPGRWVMLATFTVLLGFGIIKPSRKYWARTSFWFICAGAIALHLVAFIYLLGVYPDFKPLWFLPIVIIEATIFGVVCSMILGPSTKESPRH